MHLFLPLGYAALYADLQVLDFLVFGSLTTIWLLYPIAEIRRQRRFS